MTDNYLNIPAAGQPTMKFVIQPGVYNFAKSRLMYKRTIADQGANNNVWTPVDTLGEIVGLKLKTINGLALIDIDDYNMVMQVLATKEYKASKFQSNDDSNLIRKCDTLATANYMATAALGQSTGFVNYLEKKQNDVGPIGVGAVGTGAHVRYVDVPGADFHNTVLSLDKDFPVGEPMTLEIKFAAAKAGWYGTSATAPATGAAELKSGTAANINGAATNFCVYLENLRFVVMCDVRQGIVDKVISQFDSQKGLAIYVPWIKTAKQSKSGNQVTFSTDLSSSDGLYLRKAITAVFANAESKNVIFDHSNLPTTNGAGDDEKALRVKSFRTRVDQKTQQDQDLIPTMAVASDWVIMKDVMEGGVIQTRKQFYRDWQFSEQFLPESPENGMQPPEALGGLDLNQAAKSFRNYQFVATMQDTGNLCWLGIFVTTRLITLWPNKVEMQ